MNRKFAIVGALTLGLAAVACEAPEDNTEIQNGEVVVEATGGPEGEGADENAN